MPKPSPVDLDESSSYAGAEDRTSMALERISAQVDFLIDEQASNQTSLLAAIASVVSAIEGLSPL